MRTRRRLLAALVLSMVTSGLGAPAAQAGGHPENGRISFGRSDLPGGDTSLWVADADGDRQRRLTTVASSFSDWSPDGRRIAFDFVDDSGVHLASVSPEGGPRRQITSGVGIHEAPEWSPDGRWIAYDASTVLPDDPAFQTSIWLVRPDGTGAHPVTSGAFDVEPTFSPDGRRIAFGRLAGTSPDGAQLEAIDVVDVDGSNRREVVPPRAGLEHPDWSPDGRRIAFDIAPEVGDLPDAGSVLTVRPDGRELTVLRPATARFGFFKPVWSPDGRFLLVGCSEKRTRIDLLCTTTARGTQLRVVIDESPLSVNFPAWGPPPRGR